MIVVITCGGKSHFHKVRPPPPSRHSFPLLFLSLLSPLFPPPSSLLSPSAPLFLLSPLICTSPTLFILHLPLALTLHLSPPCGRLIPLSYSFFCPKDIFPPTRPRLIPLSLSIYLYQWAKVILSSSSRWTDSACGRGQEKRGAECRGTQFLLLHKFSCIKLWEYYINSPL